MHTRVLLLFWECVGECHPQGKHRLGEEAIGALMVFWVPRPSVLLKKGSRHAVWGHFIKRHSEMWVCLHASVQSCHQHQKMSKPRMRGGTDVAHLWLLTNCRAGVWGQMSPHHLNPSLCTVGCGKSTTHSLQQYKRQWLLFSSQ